MRFKFLLIGFFLIVIFILFVVDKNVSGEIISVDSNGFSDLLNSEDVFVLNTHNPYMGEIEGTDLIAEDWENLDSFKNDLPQNKSKKILIYCRSGRMSSIVAEQLLELGYKEIYNLEGGMKSWEASGKELVNLR